MYVDCEHFTFDLLEGLVDGPEPTHVRTRSEHEEPDNGQSEVSHATATKHPHEAGDEIHHKSSGVHCRSKTCVLYFSHRSQTVSVNRHAKAIKGGNDVKAATMT